MKKFVNLCKKPLLILSAVVFVLFTALLVVSFITPLGKSYSGTQTVSMKDLGFSSNEKIKFSATLTLVDDKTLEVSSKIDAKQMKSLLKEVMGDLYNEEYINNQISELEKDSKKQFSYTKKDGKIVSSIGTYEMKGNKLVPAGAEKLDMQVSLVCTANSAIQITSIVLMVVSGIALAGCVVVIVLDKKGVFNKKSEAAAE